jgi:hypothetical protein
VLSPAAAGSEDASHRLMRQWSTLCSLRLEHGGGSVGGCGQRCSTALPLPFTPPVILPPSQAHTTLPLPFVTPMDKTCCPRQRCRRTRRESGSAYGCGGRRGWSTNRRSWSWRPIGCNSSALKRMDLNGTTSNIQIGSTRALESSWLSWWPATAAGFERHSGRRFLGWGSKGDPC